VLMQEYRNMGVKAGLTGSSKRGVTSVWKQEKRFLSLIPES
jgi:hypothetical protein